MGAVRYRGLAGVGGFAGIALQYWAPSGACWLGARAHLASLLHFSNPTSHYNFLWTERG